jgi:putative endonuclease
MGFMFNERYAQLIPAHSAPRSIGKPVTPNLSDGFYYVYILVSEADPDRYYIGTTENPETRIKYHNQGKVPHTSQHRPWRIKNAISFRSKEKALEFEQYLKSHSGRAFAKKHF